MSLLRNGCIDEEFKGRDRVLEIFQSVNEKCEIAKKSLLGSKCGTVPMASSRIIRGIETERGQWLKRDLFFVIWDLFLARFRPFLVALLVESTQSFFCSGNLISSKHVLTAAHCVQEKGQTFPLDARDVIVLVGRHNLSMRAERGSTTREISEIFLHPDWDPFSSRYDADVAVLVMEAAVKFSAFVQPVCLVRGSSRISEILGRSEGTVVSCFANS